MKEKMSFIVAIMMIFAMIFSTLVSATEVMPYYNNTSYTGTNFAITDDGTAIVAVSCDGYSFTTRITVSIRIEKRSFLFFWNEVLVDSHTVRDTSYYNEFEYQLEDKGTYRCTVTYSVSGSGGADDTISQEFTDTY